jgi:6,7-dimethyl-8-ribityllumazine synthase
VSDGDRWPEAPELAGPPGEDDEVSEVEQEEPAADEPVGDESVADEAVEDESVEDEPAEEPADAAPATSEHAQGEFSVPDGYGILQGQVEGGRRAVGIVVSRFNGAVTSKLLDGALAELETAGVARDAITVMPVPGAFELPIAAMALAKTRRYACIVALGCVIRGDTPHFDFVAGEAASGLQLAALETGVPVAFGLLTLEQADQADDRIDKGAEAVRTGLEMADVFAQLRAAAAR